MIQPIARVASSLLSLYMMVIFIRIIMTWFRGVHYGRAYLFLTSITDPYLDWFRRNTPVRLGMMDFSPVVGILALGFAQNILTEVAHTGTVTMSFLLLVIVSSVWSVVSFFFTIFLILGLIRLAGILAGLDTGGGRFWIVIEQILNPVLQVVVRPFLRGRFTNYRDSLLIYCGVLLAVLVGGRFLLRFILALIGQIPF
ncbi:YggT family protein [Alkalispirochaeta americana]|uniref:YggT family protein n=2 Tax=Alkalispirochaeta americana TaxID=159291 RepID=A0A1N6WHR7_9SPIO|nr:YggT family protein [Alkalispirochaeta americana]